MGGSRLGEAANGLRGLFRGEERERKNRKEGDKEETVCKATRRRITLVSPSVCHLENIVRTVDNTEDYHPSMVDNEIESYSRNRMILINVRELILIDSLLLICVVNKNIHLRRNNVLPRNYIFFFYSYYSADNQTRMIMMKL